MANNQRMRDDYQTSSFTEDAGNLYKASKRFLMGKVASTGVEPDE